MKPPRAPLSSLSAPAPWLLLSLTILAWSGNVVAIKLGAGEISFMALICLRWLIVCALVLAWAGRDAISALKELRPHWRYMLAMGALGYTGSNFFLFEGARFTSGINVAIIPGVMPVLVVIGARFFYGTRISAMRALGVAVTVLGILIIATRGDLSTISRLDFNRGDIMELIGSFVYAGFTLALRSRPPVSAFVLFIGMALAAFVSSIPLFAGEIALGGFIMPGWRGLLVLFYVAVFTSLIGHIFWIRTVSIIGPSRAGVFQNLVPVVGAALAVTLLRERFEWFHALSLALVLGGIFISERLSR